MQIALFLLLHLIIIISNIFDFSSLIGWTVLFFLVFLARKFFILFFFERKKIEFLEIYRLHEMHRSHYTFGDTNKYFLLFLRFKKTTDRIVSYTEGIQPHSVFLFLFWFLFFGSLNCFYFHFVYLGPSCIYMCESVFPIHFYFSVIIYISNCFAIAFLR